MPTPRVEALGLISHYRLIAIDRVDRIVSNGDGSATLRLRDGSEHRVSRRRAADVRRALER